MAKVKIQGHASGTGVLTVTAPNTSTDRTITLPDATATIATTTDVAAKAPIASPEFTGNVGIDVVPESWHANWTALQLGATGFVGQYQSGATDITGLGSNVYSDGTYKHIETDEAAIIRLSDGTIDLSVAASGTADAAITFTTGLEVLNDGKARAKNGLLFGTDTAAANALDDYEEGTCTVQYSDGTTTIGNTPNTMKYTKIGRTVTVNGYINATNTDSLSGSTILKLVGFPFTNNNDTAFSVFTRYLNSPDSTHNVIGYFGNNQTFAYIYYMIDNGSYHPVACEDLATSTNDLYLSVTYQTDS